MPKIQPLKVAARVNKETNNFELFFYNHKKDNPSDYWLECFSEGEGYNVCSAGYMQSKTRPYHESEEQAVISLVKQWANIGQDVPAVQLVKRLQKPK